jgi:hypothetical protein
MKELRQAVSHTPNQLFVQAHLTIELVEGVIQTATLYYSQRVHEELGRFNWLVDRKDGEVTAMEKMWTTMIVPVGQRHALDAPLITLTEGDYTHFDRFRLPGEGGPSASDVRWLEQNITYTIHREGQRKIVDLKKIFSGEL